MKVFRIEIKSGFGEWNRYNVFATAVCYSAGVDSGGDSGGDEVMAYVNLSGDDRTLETPPCEHAEAYIYIVAREFPASDVIAKSPPFPVEIIVNGTSTTHEVNQWGGLSVKLTLE